jgi:spermidine/putrescine transport system substrate-binding protein
MSVPALHHVLAGDRRPRKTGAGAAVLTRAWRAMLKIKHVPFQLMDVLVFPIMMTFMFTYLFGGALAGSTSAYLQWLIPGIVVQTLVFLTVYTGVGLNTDITKPEQWKTYDPVFDAANKGKICVMDWGDWPILPMALHAGINPYEELDQNALEEVRKVLRAMFKNTRTLVADLTQAQKGLLDGSLLGCIGAGSYLTSAVRKQGHKNIMAIVPEPKNGLKQGIIWVEATAILKETDQPDLSQKLLKHVVSKEAGHILSLLDTTCNVVTNKAVEELYTPEERDILQTDYMWHAWDNSQMHRIAPNIDEMLAIWQEELAAAQ